MKKKYQVKLTGKGQLHETRVKLEGILINVFSSNNSGLIWFNDDVEVSVKGKLQIFMSCKALSGTEWEFVVIESASQKEVYKASGETGEPLQSDNGNRIANYSERRVSI